MLDGEAAWTVDGRLEGLHGNRLFLWVWCPELPDQPISVDLLINRLHIGQYVADNHRADLEQAGIGDGNHALSIDIDAVVQELKSDDLLEIELYTAGPVRWKIGRTSLDLRLPGSGDIPPDKARKIEAFFEPSLRRLLLSNAALQFGDSATATGGEPKYEQLLRPFAIAADAGKAAPISAYADYVRCRSRQDRTYQVELGDAEINNYLKWYLEAYCATRGDRRAPLSAGEIAYLNELILIGGQRFHLSRATWCFLVDNRDLLARLDLNSPDFYLNVAYWWSVERARSLHVEDCLVPEPYRAILAGPREAWREKHFPLTRCMEIYFNRNTIWHFLDLEIKQDRLLFYVVLLLLALTTPFILRFVPRAWIGKLVPDDETAGSGIARVAEAIFRDPRLVALLSGYRGLLRNAGFSLETMRHLTISPKGSRVLPAALPRPRDDGEAVDVQIIGPMERACGLAQAARMSAIALAGCGRSWSACDFDLDNPAPVGFHAAGTVTSAVRRARINLLHLNAESVPLAFAYLPDVFTGAYNIGYFFWELDTPAKCHALALDLLDEVWVSSGYGVDIYRPATARPVVRMGMCYEEIAVPERAAARRFLLSRLGIDDDAFVFMTSFDSYSFIQRKNPHAVVRAFRDAFPGGEPVRLLLKTHNRDAVNDPEQLKIWQSLSQAISEDPRITVVNETLPYRALIDMKAGCDCYVSLHRSEGWGFGMIEAMNLWVPVIATGYSGNLEFCTPETCWLVDYDLRPLDRDDYIFVTPGQRWAEPRHASAVAQMRDVFANREQRQERTAVARAFVAEHFSPAAISARYADRIGAILSHRPARTPG